MKPSPGGREGIALIIVLGLTALLLITCVSFSITMRVDRSSSANMRHATISRMASKSALADAVSAIDEEADSVWRPQSGGELREIEYKENGLDHRLLIPSDTLVSYGSGSKAILGSLLSGASSKYVPSGLLWKIQAGALGEGDVSAPHWMPVRTSNGAIIGRYAYSVLDTTSLLDVSAVNKFEDHSLGIDPGEIQLPCAVLDQATLNAVSNIYPAAGAVINKDVFWMQYATNNEAAAKTTLADVKNSLVDDEYGSFQSIAEQNCIMGLPNNIFNNFSYDPPSALTNCAFISSDVDDVIDNRDELMDAFLAARRGGIGMNDFGNPSEDEERRAFCDYCALVDYMDDDDIPYGEAYDDLLTAENAKYARPASEVMPLFAGALATVTMHIDFDKLQIIEGTSGGGRGGSTQGSTNYVYKYWLETKFEGSFCNPFTEDAPSCNLTVKFSGKNNTPAAVADKLNPEGSAMLDEFFGKFGNGSILSTSGVAINAGKYQHLGGVGGGRGSTGVACGISAESTPAIVTISASDYAAGGWKSSDQGVDFDLYIAAGTENGGELVRCVPPSKASYNLTPSGDSGGRGGTTISGRWIKLHCPLNADNVTKEFSAAAGDTSSMGDSKPARGGGDSGGSTPTTGESGTIEYKFWVEALDPAYSEPSFLNSNSGNAFKAQYRVSTVGDGGDVQTKGFRELAGNGAFADYVPEWNVSDVRGEKTFTHYVMTHPAAASELGLNMDGIDHRSAGGGRGGSTAGGNADEYDLQFRRYVKNAPLETVGEIGYLPIGPWFTYTLMSHGSDVQKSAYFHTPIPSCGYHTVLDCFTLADPEGTAEVSGRINLSAVSPPSVESLVSSAAAFNGLPVSAVSTNGPGLVDEYGGEVKENCCINEQNSMILAAALAAGGKTTAYEHLSDLAAVFDSGPSGSSSPLCGPVDNASSLCYASKVVADTLDDLGEFERESLIRNSAGLFTMRGRTFLVLIRGESFSPDFGKNGVTDGIVGASSTAVAQIWRDTVKDKNGIYPMFVQFFKLMD